MNIKWLLPLVFFFLPRLSSAQNDSVQMVAHSGSSNFYLINGFHFFAFNNLNKALSGASLPTVKNNNVSYGAGGFGSLDRLIFGGEGYNISSEQKNDSGTTRAQGGLGLFYFGYKLINNPQFDFYPMLGAGFGGVTVSVLKTHPDIAFSNFISSPSNSGQLGTGALLFNVSLGLDYRLRRKNSMLFGLRTGYNFSKSTEWKADNFYFVGAPKDRFANFYGALIIGISIDNEPETHWIE